MHEEREGSSFFATERPAALAVGPSCPAWRHRHGRLSSSQSRKGCAASENAARNCAARWWPRSRSTPVSASSPITRCERSQPRRVCAVGSSSDRVYPSERDL